MLIRLVTCLLVGISLLAWCAPTAVAAPEPAAEHGEEADHGPAASHGEDDGKADPLLWQTDLAIWTAVVFVCLALVLGKFAWKPIVDGLDKREQGIADDITAAEKANADAKDLLAQYQKKLAKSEDEVRQMIEVAKRDAEKAGQTIVDKSRAVASAERDRAIADIDLATAGALKELAERSADLAVNLAGKIVTARLDKADHTRLIEQAVSDFAKVDPGSN